MLAAYATAMFLLFVERCVIEIIHVSLGFYPGVLFYEVRPWQSLLVTAAFAALASARRRFHVPNDHAGVRRAYLSDRFGRDSILHRRVPFICDIA